MNYGARSMRRLEGFSHLCEIQADIVSNENKFENKYRSVDDPLKPLRYIMLYCIPVLCQCILNFEMHLYSSLKCHTRLMQRLLEGGVPFKLLTFISTFWWMLQHLLEGGIYELCEGVCYERKYGNDHLSSELSSSDIIMMFCFSINFFFPKLFEHFANTCT